MVARLVFESFMCVFAVVFSVGALCLLLCLCGADGDPATVIFFTALFSLGMLSGCRNAGCARAERLGMLACAVAMPIACWQVVLPNISQRVEQAWQKSEPAAAYCLAQFDSLDDNKDGIISTKELDAAIQRGQDTALLNHMRERVSDIGHVTDSYLVGTSIVKRYGISKADLEAYMEKINKHYRSWKGW